MPLNPLPVPDTTDVDDRLHRRIVLFRQVANGDIAHLLVVIEEAGNRSVDVTRRGAVALLTDMPLQLLTGALQERRAAAKKPHNRLHAYPCSAGNIIQVDIRAKIGLQQRCRLFENPLARGSRRSRPCAHHIGSSRFHVNENTHEIAICQVVRDLLQILDVSPYLASIPIGRLLAVTGISCRSSGVGAAGLS